MVEGANFSIELLGDDQVEEQLIVRSALDGQLEHIADVAWLEISREGRGGEELNIGILHEL